jgi:hypothetical protein
MKPDVVETVMTEILEDQKAVSSKLASLSGTLMEINTKMDDHTTDKIEDNVNTIKEQLKTLQLTCGSLTAEINLPINEINQLKFALDIHKAQLEKPVQQIVKHQVGKVIVVVGTLFIIINILIYCLLRSKDKLEQYKTNDIKYRFFELINVPEIRKQVYAIDSLYHQNADDFRNSVINAEREKQRRLALLLEASLKREEADKLLKAAGSKKKY